MGRWNDRPDDTSDDWRGWKGGKYDNRYRGINPSKGKYKNPYKKKSTKKIGAIIASVLVIGIFGFLFVNGVIEINPENLEDSIQNLPETIQKTGNTAKDFATESAEKLSETVSEKTNSLSNSIKDVQEGKPIIDIPETSEKERLAEEEIHKLVNLERKKRGLNELSYDANLAKIAKSHSSDMYERSYFAHETPEGKDPTDRGISQGYECQKRTGNIIWSGIAENIFMVDGASISFWESPESIANDAVSGWMDSLGHRENILTKTYDKEGIGVKIGSFDIYVTQNFC